MRLPLALTLLVAFLPEPAIADPTRLDVLRRVFDARVRHADGIVDGVAWFDVSPPSTRELRLATSVYDSVMLGLRRRRGARLAFGGTCIRGGDIVSTGRGSFVVQPTRARVRLTGVLRCDDRHMRVKLSAPIGEPPPVPSGPYLLTLRDRHTPLSALSFTLVVDERGVGRLTDAAEHDPQGTLRATFDDADVVVAPSGIIRFWTPRHAVEGPAPDGLEGLALHGTLSSPGGGRFYVGAPPHVPREGAWEVTSTPTR